MDANYIRWLALGKRLELTDAEQMERDELKEKLGDAAVLQINDANTDTTDSTILNVKSEDTDANEKNYEKNVMRQDKSSDEDQYYDALEQRANEVAADSELYEGPDQPAAYRNTDMVALYDIATQALASSNSPEWSPRFWDLIDKGGHCNAGANTIFQTVIKALLYKKYHGVFPIIGNHEGTVKIVPGKGKDKHYTIVGEKGDSSMNHLDQIETALLDMCTSLVCPTRDPSVWFFATDVQVVTFLSDFRKRMEIKYGRSAHADANINLFNGPIPLRETEYGQNEGSLDMYEVAQVLQCVQNAETDYQVYQLATSPNQLYFRVRAASQVDEKGKSEIRTEYVPVEGGLYVKTFLPEFKLPSSVEGQYVEPRFDGKHGVGKGVEYTLVDQTSDYHRVCASRVKRYGDTLMEYTDTIPRPECGLIVLMNQCYYFAKAGLNPFALLEMRLRSRGGAANRIVSRWLEKGEPLMAYDVVQTLEDVLLNGAMRD